MQILWMHNREHLLLLEKVFHGDVLEVPLRFATVWGSLLFDFRDTL